MKKLHRFKPRPILLPALALSSVTSKKGKGVYASSDSLYKGAVFGRDSLEVAEDLMFLRPRLVQRIILTLAGLQGEANTEANEEEPGKIVHEYRNHMVDGKAITGVQREIFEELTAKWGGTPNELVYYGSVDATPLFVRTVGTYCGIYGKSLLEKPVKLRSGQTIPLRDVVQNSLVWIRTKLAGSRTGLLEYLRHNPRSFLNHAWKDSNEFYVHENGRPANHDKPIATIEVQGLVYDALSAGAQLFPKDKEKLEKLAHQIRDKTLELLWQPDRQYFALGVDYDDENNTRQISTKTANPAELLDTKFFDDLAKEDQQQYTEGIVRNIFSPDFLTDAGIRSRALSEKQLITFWDYHGSYTSWPKETHDIARGLRRHGMARLALELENRLLNAVMKSGHYPEFFYVDTWGRVLSTMPVTHEHGNFIAIETTNKPERVQAWTVSAVMQTLSRRLPRFLQPEHVPPKRFEELESEILSSMPRVKRLRGWSLRIRYPTYDYRIK